MTTNAFATRADHVKGEVEKDIQPNTRVCTVDQFTTFLLKSDEPTDDDVETILTVMTDKGLYDAFLQQWAEIPIEANTFPEQHYYQPTVNVLNELLQQPYVRNRQEKRGPSESVHGFFFDQSSQIPHSSEGPGAPKIRADIGWILRAAAAKLCSQRDSKGEEVQDSKAWLEEMVKLLNGQRMTPNAQPSQTKRKEPGSSLPEPSPPPRKPLKAEDLGIYLAWCHTILVIEVKRSRGLDYQTILHLSTYLRQILKNQLDRMFVFGFLLLHDQISLWYCDRSGLLGTYDFIDIHENPKLFIKVMLRFLTMTPSQLGWDTTMKLVLPKSLTVIPSWHRDLAFDKDGIPLTRQDTNWEIIINNERYYTVQPLSVARAEIMSGRATLVWLAIRERDLKDLKEGVPFKDLPLVVIKQAWTPFKEDSKFDLEYKVYERADLAFMTPDHEVLADCKTTTSFRRNCPTVPIYSRKEITNPSKPRPVNTETVVEQSVHYNANNPTNLPNFLECKAIIERQLNRVVISCYGLPIKYCKDYEELIQTLRGALDGLEYLDRKGICHRDISGGNILINPAGGKGILIDLDHSKVDESYGPRTISDVAATPEMQKMIRRCRELFDFQWSRPPKLPPLYLDDHTATMAIIAEQNALGRQGTGKANTVQDVADMAGLRLAAVMKALGSKASTTGMIPLNFKILTRDTMGVDKLPDMYIPPTFLSQSARHSFMTGTPAFISHEIILDSHKTHAVVHDVESVFWTTVHHTMVRAGPGAKRQDTGCPTTAMEENLRNNVFSLFEQDLNSLGKVKREVIEDSKIFKEYVLPFMSPYFKPLEPLLLAWHGILNSAFNENHNFHRDYPIPAFRKALDDFERKMKQSPLPVNSEYFKRTQAEEARRTAYEQAIVRNVTTCMRIVKKRFNGTPSAASGASDDSTSDYTSVPREEVVVLPYESSPPGPPQPGLSSGKPSSLILPPSPPSSPTPQGAKKQRMTMDMKTWSEDEE